MFSKEDILAMLRNGTNPTDLAQEFADVLDESVAAYDQEKKDAEVELQKQMDWNTLVETFCDWAMKYIPDIYNSFEKEFNAMMDVSADDVINTCNEALKKTNLFMDAMFPKEEKKAAPAAGRSEARKTDHSAEVSPEDLEALLRWVQSNNF